jgi:hypothetical protein
VYPVGGLGSTAVFFSKLPESIGLAAGRSPLCPLLGVPVLFPSFATNTQLTVGDLPPRAARIMPEDMAIP